MKRLRLRWITEDERLHLQYLICLVAHNSGQAHLADFLQLNCAES